MRKKTSYKITPVTLLLACSLMLPGSVFAEETADNSEELEFTLDATVVTAQRYQTREVETPAAVEVIDEAKIKAIGANSVQETLKYSLGINYSTYGPDGSSQGTMTSNANIRGVGNGTLVLVNGRPINIRGAVMLEKIPVSNVERIEIIRGGGSVLYGSEALGGTVNIITKKSAPNSFHYDMGNYGQYNTGTHLQAGKFGITYDQRRWGKVNDLSINTWANRFNITDTVMGMDYLNSRSDSIMATYEFNDKWSLFYAYDKTNNSWNYNFIKNVANPGSVGTTRYKREHENRQNIIQLNYTGDHFKASIFYNDLAINSKGIDYRNASGAITPGAKNSVKADERSRNIGLDAQHDWEWGKTKYLLGATGIYEYYNKETYSSDPTLHRYNYSIYASANHPFSETTSAILSMRYSWQAGNPDKNLSKFTPQLQLSQKIGKNEYIYASAGMSYKMPTLNQAFAPAGSRVEGNPDLKPQVGKNYEIGWKKDNGEHGWRVALFKYAISDKITTSYTSSTDTWRYVNEDAKNTGLEVEYTYANKNGFNYSLGATIGNPKTKHNNTHTAAARARAGRWERGFDRYELNAGIGYTIDKWSFNLHAKYLFGRSQAASTSVTYGPQDMKPALYTTLNIRYQFQKNQEFYLKIENLLDRKDVATNSTTEYYYTPFNFILGYNINF